MSSTSSPLTRLVAIDGQPLGVGLIASKTLLIVNVASACGLTPQYQALQQLHIDSGDRQVAVVGVPCNQFGGQEPGTAVEIVAFCQANYGVSFPLLQKQDVNGPERSALYRWLVDSPAGGGADIEWNFAKFVVNPQGQVVARFAPTIAPDDPRVLAALGI